MASSATDLLLTLPRFLGRDGPGYNPGLDRMKAILDVMGNPQRSAPVAHVAGTNGKGSTASMIAAIGTAAGSKVGLHTSPHLLHVTERMRIDGVPAGQSWLDQAVHRFWDVFQAIGPSFFEATVALSFLYFSEEAVDAMVVEVGLGGRLDATNVVDPTVCVITSIGLEHTEILGTTHDEIAFEKAGIIKRGVPVVSGVPDAHGGRTIRDVARRMEAPLSVPSSESVASFNIGLAGIHQVRNAALAVSAAREFWPDISDLAIARGLRDVTSLAGLRGRAEQIVPGLFGDVAHNADGIEAALQTVGEDGLPVHVLLALMSDKDGRAVARVIARYAASVTLLDLVEERVLPADELCRFLEEAGLDARGTISRNEMRAYIDRVIESGGRVLATGSHLVVAAVLEKFG